MLEQSVTEEDRAPSLTVKGRMPWHVADVEALPDFRLRVSFNDGVAGLVDLGSFIHAPNAGVFAALQDPANFARACVDKGAVIWSDVLDSWPWNLDLAPDAMHDEIAAHGEWVV